MPLYYQYKVNKEYTTASGETFSELMLVTCNWTYVPETKMDINKFAKSMNFVVVIREGRYEIVEASEKTIEIDEVEINESDEVDVEE